MCNKLLVCGFNARPIAKAAVQAGYDLGVVDYFGDLDLLALTKNCFAVLKQQKGEPLHRQLHRPPYDYLFLLAKIMIEEQEDIGGILLGSAFDRFPELIKKFGSLGPKLFGNTPEKFSLVRNRTKMENLAKKSGFKTVNSELFHDYYDLLDYVKNQNFPIVTRTDGGGGGTGIRKWLNFTSLKDYFSQHLELIEKGVYVQDFVSGVDASASVISARKEVTIVSINQQLIGIQELGAPGNFSYCGNIVPLPNKYYSNNITESALLDIITKFFFELELIGSNGIDFVIADDGIYYMEVNPRFQGSIECVQSATNRNLVSLHMQACQGKELLLPKKPQYQRTAIKGIVFSNKQQTFMVNEYPKNDSIVDRTHIGVILEPTDPFCSIVLPAKNSENAYKKMLEIKKQIWEKNGR